MIDKNFGDSAFIRFTAPDGMVLMILDGKAGVTVNPSLKDRPAEFYGLIQQCILSTISELEKRAAEAEAEVAKLKKFMH